MGKAHNRLDLDISYISSEYISGRTAQDIASELGVSKKAVLTRLRESGVQRRKHEYPDVTSEVLQDLYITQKLSTRAIADIFGCSNKFICDKLDKFGIPKRKRVGDPSFTKEERKAKWGKSREEHNLWKGGVTTLNETLRFITSDWRNEQLHSNNYTCFVTGKLGGDLHVHHIRPFHEIRDQALSDLGIDTVGRIADYDDKTMTILRDRIVELHEGERGFPIQMEIHKLFHSLYGFKTDERDLLEFKNRYLLGEFNEKLVI